MSHLNHLNLQLQGKNHTFANICEEADAFRSALNVLEQDIHWRKIRAHCKNSEMQENDFVTSLAENIYILKKRL